MGEEWGYVRVVNVRADDENFRAAPGWRAIPMDRASNPLMGNRHDMKSKSMAAHAGKIYGIFHLSDNGKSEATLTKSGGQKTAREFDRA